MFSNTEYQFVKDLILSYYSNGFKNYVCYTNNPQNSYGTQYYDIFCYYSKSNITHNNLTFTFSNDTKKCSIDTKSVNSQYKNNSIVCIDGSNSSITVDSKEFVYSNVGTNSNIIADFENTSRFYSANNVYMTSVLTLLVLVFLYIFLNKIFRS